MGRDGLPILTYHALDDHRAPTSTPLDRFVATITRLVQAGFVGVDLEDWVARGRPRVVKGFAVAFDDGLRSILPGLASLRRLGVPATVFLVTDYVGRDNAWPGQPSWVPRADTLDWSEVATLADRGVTFGSHTRTHPRLDRLGADRVEAELRGSADAIADRLGRPCRLFAYPYGVAHPTLREGCPPFAAAFGTRLARASSRDPLGLVPRIDAYYLKGARSVDLLISGRIGPWLATRRALRSAHRAASGLVPEGRAWRGAS